MSALHRPLLITTVLAAVVGVARAAPVETSTTPYPGVTHVRWTDTATQQRAHLEERGPDGRNGEEARRGEHLRLRLGHHA